MKQKVASNRAAEYHAAIDRETAEILSNDPAYQSIRLKEADARSKDAILRESASCQADYELLDDYGVALMNLWSQRIALEAVARKRVAAKYKHRLERLNRRVTK